MFCSLRDKISLVTGASRGIGRAIAKKLSELGSITYINYNSSEEHAKSLQEEITKSGGRAYLTRFDVSNYEEVSKAVDEIINTHGTIHILVNNAGITRDALLMRMKEKDWDLVFSVNMKGVFNCSKAVINAMLKARYGRIINISSVVGTMGNAGQTCYSATKGGIDAFTKSLAREVATRGITVNAVSPGFIDTEMTATLSEKIKDDIIRLIPMGRMGTPEEVANVVAFLASDEASYITGHVLHVNGGMLCI